MADSNPLKTARSVAVAVLNRFDPKRGFASTILNQMLSCTEQKQRATDLVFGTIRNRQTIDMLINKLAGRPVAKIAPKLINIIRVGIFELIYCPQTPDYAIVNDAVENTRQIGGKKQIAFVNAILREITRQIVNRETSLRGACLTRTVPQDYISGCGLKTDIFDDPQKQPAEYLSKAFSLPKWLVTNWLEEFGYEQAAQICFASNRKPGIYIRANTLSVSPEELIKHFARDEVNARIVDGPAIKLESPAAIGQLSGFYQGHFSVQDITASKPARLLQPKQNWKILDLCSAPGGKTTQLAELTGDKAHIIATDIDSDRLKLVRQNIARLKLKSVTVTEYKDLQKTVEQTSLFDCIMLDVPCSNAGVLSKRPEVRYRITPRAVFRLVKTQRELLAQAVKMLKPYGRICYSTCSIQAEENSKLVKEFAAEQGFAVECEELTLPSAKKDHDGGYCAIVVRS